jgi:uncharacterized membrane protein
MTPLQESLPLHPALVHFPVAATVLAAGALLACATRSGSERAPWLDRATFLLATAVLSTPAAMASGRLWSGTLHLWTGSSLLPPLDVEDGLLRRHVLGAALTLVLAFVGFILALATRSGRAPLWPVVLVAFAAAALACLTAHVGGAMAFGTHT